MGLVLASFVFKDMARVAPQRCCAVIASPCHHPLQPVGAHRRPHLLRARRAQPRHHDPGSDPDHRPQAGGARLPLLLLLWWQQVVGSYCCCCRRPPSLGR